LPELIETEDDEVTNVVQPDVAFEVLSPSTTKKDLREKFDLFQRMGVREYWLLEPEGRWLNRFNLGDTGRFGEPAVRDGLKFKGPLACAGGFRHRPRGPLRGGIGAGFPAPERTHSKICIVAPSRTKSGITARGASHSTLLPPLKVFPVLSSFHEAPAGR